MQIGRLGKLYADLYVAACKDPISSSKNHGTSWQGLPRLPRFVISRLSLIHLGACTRCAVSGYLALCPMRFCHVGTAAELDSALRLWLLLRDTMHVTCSPRRTISSVLWQVRAKLRARKALRERIAVASVNM